MKSRSFYVVKCLPVSMTVFNKCVQIVDHYLRSFKHVAFLFSIKRKIVRPSWWKNSEVSTYCTWLAILPSTCDTGKLHFTQLNVCFHSLVCGIPQTTLVKYICRTSCKMFFSKIHCVGVLVCVNLMSRATYVTKKSRMWTGNKINAEKSQFLVILTRLCEAYVNVHCF